MLCGEGRSAAISYFLGFGHRTGDRFVLRLLLYKYFSM